MPFQLFWLQLDSQVFIVVWIVRYEAERKSRSRGCACVKNTFAANGRLAGLRAPSLRTMSVVMVATSRLFPWEQRTKSSLTESCRCPTSPQARRRAGETDSVEQVENGEKRQFPPGLWVTWKRPVLCLCLLLYWCISVFPCAACQANQASVIA